jgi:hypothetical protein
MNEEAKPSFMLISDIVEENGKTIKEVKLDEWFGGGACQKLHARLWVVLHTRDCDGTPLYTLSHHKDAAWAIESRQCHYGVCEESLNVVEITDALEYGTGALSWNDEE